MPGRITAERELSRMPRPEHRAARREPCRADDSCLLIVSQRYLSRWARPRDVSTSGMGLATSGPFETGALVLIEFFAGRGQPPLTLLAEVVHSEPAADGSWALGCRFDNLRGDLGLAEREQIQDLLCRQADGCAANDPQRLRSALAESLGNPFRPLLRCAPTRPDAGGRGRENHVNALFDLLLVTRNKLPMRKKVTDLAEVASWSLESMRGDARRRELRLASCIPAEALPVLADSVRLEGAIANLLLDVIERSAVGSRLWLAVESAASEAVVRVGGDAVAGLEALPAAADLLDAPAACDGAAGWEAIRRALTRGVIEMHGGGVEVGSSVANNARAEYRVRLPLASGAA